jgi:hypothetical protein
MFSLFSVLRTFYQSQTRSRTHGTTTEKEAPSPPILRTYTLLHSGGANSRDLSILPEGSSSAIYTTAVEPIIEMQHPNSITLYCPSSPDPIAGVVRMYHGCDTMNMAFGDPEDFSKSDNSVWEDILVKPGSRTTHEFGLGLGDDLRRGFEWQACHNTLTAPPATLSPATEKHAQGKSSPGRTPSGGIPEHAARTHSWSLAEKKAKPRNFKLVDRNDGETVAMFVHPELVGHDANAQGEMSRRGKFVIFRDFWKHGLYVEEWDKAVLLSGLAVLERVDREQGASGCGISES